MSILDQGIGNDRPSPAAPHLERALAKAAGRIRVPYPYGLADHLVGQGQLAFQVVALVVGIVPLDEQVRRIGGRIGDAPGDGIGSPHGQAGPSGRGHSDGPPFGRNQADGVPDAGKPAGVEVRIVGQYRRTPPRPPSGRCPAVGAADGAGLGLRLLMHRHQRFPRRERVIRRPPAAVVRVYADERDLCGLLASQPVHETLGQPLGAPVLGKVVRLEQVVRADVLQRVGRRRRPGNAHRERKLMRPRADVGIDAFEIPLVHFPAGRLETGRKPAGQLPDSEHSHADVVAFSTRSDPFGQTAIDRFAGQEHLGQPVLRGDESLRPDCVRQRLRMDVRDPVAVPPDRNRRIQHAQRNRLVDGSRASRNVAGAQPQ